MEVIMDDDVCYIVSWFSILFIIVFVVTRPYPSSIKVLRKKGGRRYPRRVYRRKEDASSSHPKHACNDFKQLAGNCYMCNRQLYLSPLDAP